MPCQPNPALTAASFRGRIEPCSDEPSQIRALRRRRNMTQEMLADVTGMKQSRISAVERPGELLSVDTLIRLASAFKVGLIVKFVPFSEMLKWENSFCQDSYDATRIDQDEEFLRPDVGGMLEQHATLFEPDFLEEEITPPYVQKSASEISLSMLEAVGGIQ